MRSHRIEFLVYFIGLVPLGIFLAQVREAIGHDGLAFAAVVLYLLGLRFLGRWLAGRYGRDEPSAE